MRPSELVIAGVVYLALQGLQRRSQRQQLQQLRDVERVVRELNTRASPQKGVV